MGDIKVSIIIPVYKVERFIRRCAESLFNQTFSDIEYIFIDDCSPDSSIDILKQTIQEFPDKKVKILRHDENRGLPAARNTGLSIAQGDYIFHCDSDDYVEPTMIEEMYENAIIHDADIVWCDWILSLSNSERIMHQPSFTNSTDAVKSLLGGGMKFNVWNKLVKRSLYINHDIRFPEGRAMGEDLTIIKLFALAKKISYIPKAFYHYVKTNSNAYSRNYTDKNLLDLKYNIETLSEWLKTNHDHLYDKEINFLKLESKFPFLFMEDKKRFYTLWKEWFPEANPFIKCNEYISFRSRLVQLLALKGYYRIITAYSFFLNKIVYGLIFR